MGATFKLAMGWRDYHKNKSSKLKTYNNKTESFKILKMKRMRL